MRKVIVSIVAIAIASLFAGCAQQTCAAKPAPKPVVVKPAPVPVVVDEKSAAVK